MDYLMQLLSDPTIWLALATLIAMEVVLGIDNLVFISILTNKLPEAVRSRARRIGIGLALFLRLALLGTVAWIVGLTDPVFEIFGKGFSWKDVILIAGGLFLIWKATKEIHHNVDPDPHGDMFAGRQPAVAAPGHDPKHGPMTRPRSGATTGAVAGTATDAIPGSTTGSAPGAAASSASATTAGSIPGAAASPVSGGPASPAAMSFSSAIVQILLLDLVFSVDSIITAVGMTPHVPVMVVAVIVAVTVMLIAADPLASFINRHPTVVMLALGFLLMIGMTLIADGFGAHVPKGYIYSAMLFSGLIEGLNMMARRARRSQRGIGQPG